MARALALHTVDLNRVLVPEEVVSKGKYWKLTSTRSRGSELFLTSELVCSPNVTRFDGFPIRISLKRLGDLERFLFFLGVGVWSGPVSFENVLGFS